MVNQGWIEGYLDGIKKIAETIDREAIGRAVEMVWGAWQRGNTIFTCGNGGSAGTAPPPPAGPFQGTNVPNQPPPRAVGLGGKNSLLRAPTHHQGRGKVYVEQVEKLFPARGVFGGIIVHRG